MNLTPKARQKALMSEEQKPKVIIFEDDRFYIESLSLVLMMHGIEIVAIAYTMTEADALIKTLTETTAAAALVDGNLTKGDSTGKDGSEILSKIRAKGVALPTIGNSLNPMPEADYDLTKRAKARVLIALIFELAGMSQE